MERRHRRVSLPKLQAAFLKLRLYGPTCAAAFSRNSDPLGLGANVCQNHLAKAPCREPAHGGHADRESRGNLWPPLRPDPIASAAKPLGLAIPIYAPRTRAFAPPVSVS